MKFRNKHPYVDNANKIYTAGDKPVTKEAVLNIPLPSN